MAGKRTSNHYNENRTRWQDNDSTIETYCINQRNWSYSKVIELIIEQGFKLFSLDKAKKFS